MVLKVHLDSQDSCILIIDLALEAGKERQNNHDLEFLVFLIGVSNSHGQSIHNFILDRDEKLVFYVNKLFCFRN